MPLELRPCGPEDMRSWIRIRASAYKGPTHNVVHGGRPVRASSLLAAAEARKEQLKKPNTWHWKIVDTNLDPHEDEPADNGGRTISVSAWALKNVKDASPAPTESVDEAPTVVKSEDSRMSYLPPEVRVDVLQSLFDPLGKAQEEIMGTEEPYLMLMTLATLSEHRGRKCGQILLNWGLEMADQRGLKTYLDATEMGRHLYHKNRFQDVRAIEWDREPWGGQGVDCHWCMVREPLVEHEH